VHNNSTERPADAITPAWLAIAEEVAGVHPNRGYRKLGYKSFTAYMRDRWGVGRGTGYEYLHAIQRLNSSATRPEVMPPLHTLSRHGARQRLTPEIRWAVWERDDFRCTYCGVRRFLTIDHVIPIRTAGDDALSNLVTACRRCNSGKRDRLWPRPGGE
jgi:hypothetical protein